MLRGKQQAMMERNGRSLRQAHNKQDSYSFKSFWEPLGKNPPGYTTLFNIQRWKFNTLYSFVDSFVQKIRLNLI